jgi:ABC-type Fe3+/spermidine/putrescine transport system ATPase subunit
MTDSALLDANFSVARRSFDVTAQLSLAAGERLSLFGPSGAGKTTCLEAIAGTVPLQLGEIRLDGRLVNNVKGRRARTAPAGRRPTAGGELQAEPRKRGVAVVRQPTTLFPHLSVQANVLYGLPRTARRAQPVADLLALVGLEGLADAMPDTLSGGQRQRVCLARAIARPFRALLLDEPFSAVDFSSRAQLRVTAAEAVGAAGGVSVLVTHDLPEAQAYGDRLGIMDAGTVLQIGDAGHLVRHPATVRVAELCGYTSFVPHGSGHLLALHPDRFVEGAHPDQGPVLRGTVVSVAPFGPRFVCQMAPENDGCAGDAIAPVDNVAGRPEARQLLIRVHAEVPPRVGDAWEVTGVGPPLVSRVSPKGREQAGAEEG